jgi:hypothetical protein
MVADPTFACILTCGLRLFTYAGIALVYDKPFALPFSNLCILPFMASNQR